MTTRTLYKGTCDICGIRTESEGNLFIERCFHCANAIGKWHRADEENRTYEEGVKQARYIGKRAQEEYKGDDEWTRHVVAAKVVREEMKLYRNYLL